MPGPQRIEFKNAFYHVMNRCRARQVVFHNERYYQTFLKALCEVKQRFQCVIHAYCQMGKHYHLLLQTPGLSIENLLFLSIR
ncbi:MAG: transposase [Candidatus Thiodiazotropha sp. (ex Ustalcina ferruginea)]|nr:transposase [Candidatus Thiodiazotropha sp. (ex Ustalcina ferruginea)]